MLGSLTSSLGEADCALARYVHETIYYRHSALRAACLSEAEGQVSRLYLNTPQAAVATAPLPGVMESQPLRGYQPL